jgi:hypothetical protein
MDMQNESINSVREISNLSWIVYKSKKSPMNKSKYIIKEGDVIKLGREILLVKNIHIKKNINKNERINNKETIKDNNGIIVSFHTQTSQSLNLNEDFNNFENNDNNLEEKEECANNETGGDENNEKSSNNEKENKNKTKDLISCNESDKNSLNPKKNKKICRICYMKETDKKYNPLIKPCKCSGSMKYIHYQCLLHWLKTKVLVNNNNYCDNGFFSIYLLNLIECELCKNPLPNYIQHENKIYSLIDYDKFNKERKNKKKEGGKINTNDNYIIFDEVNPGKQGNKFRFLVKFDSDNIIKIGRGLEMQLILNDISVSRSHCQLKIDEEGNLILEDSNSKFGSLVLVQADLIEILKGKTLTLQVGTNYLNLKLGIPKNTFGCCGVEEIDERNSYEKINSNAIKYDKTNEILNESITPENSDNEDNNIQKNELTEKEKNLNNLQLELNGYIDGNKNNKNDSSIVNNISTLKINDSQKKILENNMKLIKNRIDSLNSKGSYLEGSSTKIKNEDKKITFKKENVILSENEKEEENNNINKHDNNENNVNSDESNSESDDSDDESEESSN